MKEWFDKFLMAEAYLAGGEPALRLVAQLTGNAPCSKCDYVKKHCKCQINSIKN